MAAGIEHSLRLNGTTLGTESAEYTSLATHSAIRGGITAGSTSFSEHGRYGSYAVLSPLVFEDPYAGALAELRDDERYPPYEAASLAGAYTAQEGLGHLLLGLEWAWGIHSGTRIARGGRSRGWMSEAGQPVWARGSARWRAATRCVSGQRGSIAMRGLSPI